MSESQPPRKRAASVPLEVEGAKRRKLSQEPAMVQAVAPRSRSVPKGALAPLAQAQTTATRSRIVKLKIAKNRLAAVKETSNSPTASGTPEAMVKEDNTVKPTSAVARCPDLAAAKSRGVVDQYYLIQYSDGSFRQWLYSTDDKRKDTEWDAAHELDKRYSKMPPGAKGRLLSKDTQLLRLSAIRPPVGSPAIVFKDDKDQVTGYFGHNGYADTKAEAVAIPEGQVDIRELGNKEYPTHALPKPSQEAMRADTPVEEDSKMSSERQSSRSRPKRRGSEMETSRQDVGNRANKAGHEKVTTNTKKSKHIEAGQEVETHPAKRRKLGEVAKTTAPSSKNRNALQTGANSGEIFFGTGASLDVDAIMKELDAQDSAIGKPNDSTSGMTKPKPGAQHPLSDQVFCIPGKVRIKRTPEGHDRVRFLVEGLSPGINMHEVQERFKSRRLAHPKPASLPAWDETAIWNGEGWTRVGTVTWTQEIDHTPRQATTQIVDYRDFFNGKSRRDSPSIYVKRYLDKGHHGDRWLKVEVRNAPRDLGVAEISQNIMRLGPNVNKKALLLKGWIDRDGDLQMVTWSHLLESTEEISPEFLQQSFSMNQFLDRNTDEQVHHGEQKLATKLFSWNGPAVKRKEGPYELNAVPTPFQMETGRWGWHQERLNYGRRGPAVETINALDEGESESDSDDDNAIPSGFQPKARHVLRR